LLKLGHIPFEVLL